MVELNGEVLEEVENFKYPGTTIAANGGMKADMSNKVNEGLGWKEKDYEK